MVGKKNDLDVELCQLINKNKSHNMNHPLMSQPLIKCTPLNIPSCRCLLPYHSVTFFSSQYISYC